MKITLRHTDIKDLVPKHIYDKEGDQSITHMTMDIVQTVEQLWDFFITYYKEKKVSIVINNWKDGGKYNYRGYRDPSCTEGAPKSQHRSGNAVDLDLYVDNKRIDPNEVRKIIIKNRSSFPLISRMEDKVNWVHIDCKKPINKDIYLFKV